MIGGGRGYPHPSGAIRDEYKLEFFLYSVFCFCHYRSVMTHASVPPAEKIKLGLTDNLIRVSVGLEDVNDLIDDFKQAFESL